MVQEKNQRSHPRNRLLKEVKLLINPPNGAVSATVRNVSQTGARLELGAEMLLPLTFIINFVSDRQMQEAEVIWQRGKLVGVSFISERKAMGLRKVDADSRA
jgi:PilZ domain